MSMGMRQFAQKLQEIKASVKEGHGTEELAQQLHGLTEQLRKTFSAEELKAAIAANDPVPTGLEEAMTTLYMGWLSTRSGT